MMRQTGQGRPIDRSICNKPPLLIESKYSVWSTKATYISFCSFPVPCELPISCRLCRAVIRSRIDSRVRCYQRGVEKTVSAGCACVPSQICTENIFTRWLSHMLMSSFLEYIWTMDGSLIYYGTALLSHTEAYCFIALL